MILFEVELIVSKNNTYRYLTKKRIIFKMYYQFWNLKEPRETARLILFA